ncbi:MAG: CaiB/BaiF CoA-transferase family protein [Nevskia sp.]|nr:CaiB/BaiF CoA-transferase family protein [Nevskia sp.]
MTSNPLLHGVRVLDLSRLLPGPFCTLYLAQLGAEVIKIEEPNGGDYARAMSAEMFSAVNRGKKSVTLDLRQAADVALFKKLVVDADVLIESFRPGVMDRLGCGYEVLKAINPRLVFAALTGYGQTGPYRDRPGHDMNYRGYAGELEQTGNASTGPAVGNLQVADIAGGALSCAVGILAALLGTKSSGVGSFVDVGMMDATLAMQVLSLSAIRTFGKSPPRGGDFLSGALPNYGVYECADGKHLAVGSLEPKFFAEVLKLIGRADLAKLPCAPGKAGEPLRQELIALFKTRSRDEWETLLAHEETCVSAILTPSEALKNEQVVARNMVVDDNGKPAFNLPIFFDNAHAVNGQSPKLGADNDAVLGPLRG